jgi:hypothetical protein
MEELYRSTTIGSSLLSTLTSMVERGELTPAMAQSIVAKFDKVQLRLR